jgi:hypothetical protein
VRAAEPSLPAKFKPDINPQGRKVPRVIADARCCPAAQGDLALAHDERSSVNFLANQKLSLRPD